MQTQSSLATWENLGEALVEGRGNGGRQASAMATDADVCWYVHERFSAVLIWEHSPISGVFELNDDLSSASRLSLVEYTHSSRSYLFAVGAGLIGRAAGLPTGSLLRLELTPELTATDYHRVVEARAAGVKATSALHWKEGVVIEFVCSSEQELDTNEEHQSRMLRAFANGISGAGSSTSSIIAAHTILRQHMDTPGGDLRAADEQQSANEPTTSGVWSGRETTLADDARDRSGRFKPTDPNSDDDELSDDAAWIARGSGERSRSGTPVAEETALLFTRAGQGAEPGSDDDCSLGMGQLASEWIMPLTEDVQGSTSERQEADGDELSPVTEENTADDSASSPHTEDNVCRVAMESHNAIPHAEESDDDELWRDMLLDMGEHYEEFEIVLDDDDCSMSSTPSCQNESDSDDKEPGQARATQLIPLQRPPTPLLTPEDRCLCACACAHACTHAMRAVLCYKHVHRHMCCVAHAASSSRSHSMQSPQLAF